MNTIKKLAEVSGTEITDLESLKAAVIKRLDFFCLNGCRFTDVGIPYLPDRIAADILGEWVNGGECDKESTVRLAEKISYYNIKELTEQ